MTATDHATKPHRAAFEGCHVLGEAGQHGAIALEEIGRKDPGALERYHQQWIEVLGRAAETSTVFGG